MKEDDFSPLGFVATSSDGNFNKNIAVLLLNMNSEPADYSETFRSNFVKLWNSSKFKACADGGANFIYKLIEENKLEDAKSTTISAPNLISGDFDSILPNVKEYFEKLDKDIVIETPDQNETDFTKAVKLIAEKIVLHKLDINLVAVVGANSTRFDHTMANINTLFKAKSILPSHIRICHILHKQFVCLLNEGKTTLQVDSGLEGDWCGLIPIGTSVTISTSGLKWNMTDNLMKFGKLISTSNELDGSGKVRVTADGCVLWTMGQNFL